MNFHEAEVLGGLLEEAGHAPADGLDEADLVVLVTCCVRHSAEDRARGRLGALKRWKSERPGRMLAVGGCMPQQPGAAERLARTCPHVDLIFGPHNLHRLPEMLAAACGASVPRVEIAPPPDEPPEGLPARRQPGVRAWVTIIHGCSRFCAYCIVPHVRGPERSRHPDAILAELRQLADAGYREVVLLGQNVNSYGRDLQGHGPEVDFGDLLELADGVSGLARIRFTTSHPADFADRFIATMARCPRVCEHVHLPAQAGSDRVLEAMRRGYTREQYLELVRRLREVLPGVAITTDLIVGFPGETEEDFAATLALVEEARFDAAFTFMYSDRRGTAAAEREGKVPLEVRRERLARLNQLQNRISREVNLALEGSLQEVLVEGPSERDPDRLTGRTRTNKLVSFPAGRERPGELVQVRISRARSWTLEGKVEDAR